ncbi:hypothetical protein KIW84_010845 [Lathyrus oleraceus]|uniref:Uncharacterized protein n=1 Tax=Pisum sativum TaxID=3888 RepID=A0A9D5BEB8_PEA|nr:hypothetical protein KIW84_010845 [Pisum sativum]
MQPSTELELQTKHTNHSSGITTSLDNLIYHIGTVISFDFGECVFDKVLKQVESYAIKLPISISTLISRTLVSQRPDILISEEVVDVSRSSVSKSLWEMIVVSTTHKNRVDESIKMLIPKDVGASTSQLVEQDNVMTTPEQDGNNNEDVSSASEIGYSYGSSNDSKED